MANVSLRERITEIVKNMDFKQSMHFRLASELKEKQLDNAVKRIAPDISKEDIIAFMDTTVMDSGKNGFILTEKGIYGLGEGKTIWTKRQCTYCRWF